MGDQGESSSYGNAAGLLLPLAALGATLVGHSMLLTMRVTPYDEQHYGG